MIIFIENNMFVTPTHQTIIKIRSTRLLRRLISENKLISHSKQ